MHAIIDAANAGSTGRGLQQAGLGVLSQPTDPDAVKQMLAALPPDPAGKATS